MISLDVCSTDWQHFLNCCGGHEYAPTGVGDTRCDTCAAAAEVGLCFGVVGVWAGAAWGGACATGMATAMVRRDVKEVKSVVKCIVACWCAIMPLYVYYRDETEWEASATLSTGYVYSRTIRTDAVGCGSWGSKECSL